MNKLTRGIALVLLGLTVIMTFLGAVGSICISWFPEQYDFPALVPYKPVYQTATIFTFVAGGLGLAALIGWLRRKPWAYRLALAALILGLLTAGTKMFFSARLRGSTAPTNIRFYLTAVTLLAWLAWGRRSDVPGDGSANGPAEGTGPSAGVTLLLVLGGLLVWSTPWWAGPSHFILGYNWVRVLEPHLGLAGGLMLAAAAWRMGRAWARRTRPAPAAQELRAARGRA